MSERDDMAVLCVVVLVLLQSLMVGCQYPFRNTSLPWNTRVDDLVGRLTMKEIMVQMARGGAGTKGGLAPPIKRLGINAYAWNTECLRGPVDQRGTAFPQAIGLAATFSPELIYRIAEATAEEVRGMYNDHVRAGNYGDHPGLSCFSPVINIVRHPLWGRTQETYGEDPYMSGTLASSFVHGLQGSHPRYIRANAGCKHFDVHGGPENIPVSRFSFDAKVSRRDWMLTFLPAFKSCVKAGSYSLMCSYNRLNGVPACANGPLLTNILRDVWNFTGYVISDQGAIENIILWHRYYNNTVDTVAGCVNAGCNLELSSDLKVPVYLSMLDAIKEGKLTEETVKKRVKPLFYTRMRLGEFDPVDMNPYNKINSSVVQSREHRDLALTAAMMSFVLLKNTNGFLPLKNNFSKIAVVGPMANNSEQLFGDYTPIMMAQFTTTPLDGLRKLSSKTSYTSGCDDNKCLTYNSTDVEKAVKKADIVFVCLGTGQVLESEGNDRANLSLPGHQLQLLRDAVQFSGGSPVVLLLFNAGPLDVSWADQNQQVAAIMACFFPAQATGEAIRRVLTNDGPGANPAGRLPVTWPMSMDQVLPMTNYTMVGRTYRYFKDTPLYPFGYGLSYATFSYGALSFPSTINAGSDLTMSGNITNQGPVEGREVIQVYIGWKDTKDMPQWQLVKFSRIPLTVPAAGTHEFSFIIEAEKMAIWNDEKGFMILPGRMMLAVGGQQPFQKKIIPGSRVVIGEFTIHGSVVLGKY